MSYAIKYDSGTSRKYPERKVVSKKRKKLIAVAVACVAVFIALQIASIRRLLLPGDPVVTERAIVKAVDELQAGESVQDAITTFCREIIESDLADDTN